MGAGGTLFFASEILYFSSECFTTPSNFYEKERCRAMSHYGNSKAAI
jgi:hypothetical protein